MTYEQHRKKAAALLETVDKSPQIDHISDAMTMRALCHTMAAIELHLENIADIMANPSGSAS